MVAAAQAVVAMEVAAKAMAQKEEPVEAMVALVECYWERRAELPAGAAMVRVMMATDPSVAAVRVVEVQVVVGREEGAAEEAAVAVLA